MDADQTTCVTCNVVILKTTAARNGGLCMPCLSGSRKSIEAVRGNLKHVRLNTDPFDAFWTNLVKEVHAGPGGFEALSKPKQLYFAVEMVVREVLNGGFDQYFWNSSSSYLGLAREWVREVGCDDVLELIDGARVAMFGNDAVPVNVAERREYLSARQSGGSPTENVLAVLEVLDTRFGELSEDLELKLREFASRQGLVAANA